MKKLLFILAGCLLTWQIGRTQEKVYLPFFEVVNVHADYQYSLSKLFQKYVADQKKYVILLPEWNNEPYPQESKEVTQSRAQELGAPFFIKGDMNALGDLIIVTMTMYRSDNGAETWNALLKADKMDDLDPILMTCARDLGEKNTTTTGGDIYTVSEQEGKELVEVETKISGGLLLGGAYVFGGSVAPGIGFLGTYDNRTIIYGVDFVGFFKEENTVGYVDITVDKPFSTAKNTGFAGGGLGWGWLTYHDPDMDPYVDEADNGLMLFAGGGVILNRTASARFIIGSRIFVPLFKVNGEIKPGINFFLALNISRKAKRRQTIDVNMN